MYELFLFTFDLKYPNKLHLKCILYRNFNSFNFRNWVAVGVVVVHAGLSAVSDCAMVRKVKVTNGMQELRISGGHLTFWLWESNLHAKYLSH